MTMFTKDVRAELEYIYWSNPFQPMVEIKGASFVADKPAIIGEPNEKYIKHEIEWYAGQSLNINDIPGGAPTMWRRAANEKGEVNSNYGWVMWSEENGQQGINVREELLRDHASRRAVVIYTRPTMHVDQKLGGSGQDFMCTNAVHYSINPLDRTLEVVVQMRSNDVVFGYRNDYAWQRYAQMWLVEELNRENLRVQAGKILWQAASLHVYPRHYHLLRHASDQKVVDGDVR